jgi:hypothetical protein
MRMTRSRSIPYVFAVVVLTASVHSQTQIESRRVNQATLLAPGPAPLIQKESLLYEGLFALPAEEVNGSRFGFGGGALAFNRERKTLFVMGHERLHKAAEITIPELSPSLATAKRAAFVQPFFDPTDTQYLTITSSAYALIGGMLPWGDRLITTVYDDYDAIGSQKASHFVSGRDLSVPTDTIGPFEVGKLKAGYVSGYMGVVPQAWREAFGGPALTGNCCISIIGRTSYGPAVSAFNPDDLGTAKQIPATPLLYYPANRPLKTFSGEGSDNPFFNAKTQITGVVFPEGTRSVLFFGKHSLGVAQYGPGGYGSTLPDVYYVWAYDALDLAAVKSGLKQPWEPIPYAVWELNLPVESASKIIKGAAYDPATNRIFLTQYRGESPLVHVFKIQLR